MGLTEPFFSRALLAFLFLPKPLSGPFCAFLCLPESRPALFDSFLRLFLAHLSHSPALVDFFSACFGLSRPLTFFFAFFATVFASLGRSLVFCAHHTYSTVFCANGSRYSSMEKWFPPRLYEHFFLTLEPQRLQVGWTASGSGTTETRTTARALAAPLAFCEGRGHSHSTRRATETDCTPQTPKRAGARPPRRQPRPRGAGCALGLGTHPAALVAELLGRYHHKPKRFSVASMRAVLMARFTVLGPPHVLDDSQGFSAPGAKSVSISFLSGGRHIRDDSHTLEPQTRHPRRLLVFFWALSDKFMAIVSWFLPAKLQILDGSQGFGAPAPNPRRRPAQVSAQGCAQSHYPAQASGDLPTPLPKPLRGVCPGLFRGLCPNLCSGHDSTTIRPGRRQYHFPEFPGLSSAALPRPPDENPTTCVL